MDVDLFCSFLMPLIINLIQAFLYLWHLLPFLFKSIYKSSQKLFPLWEISIKKEPNIAKQYSSYLVIFNSKYDYKNCSASFCLIWGGGELYFVLESIKSKKWKFKTHKTFSAKIQVGKTKLC